jgi:hypothetical protein
MPQVPHLLLDYMVVLLEALHSFCVLNTPWLG